MTDISDAFFGKLIFVGSPSKLGVPLDTVGITGAIGPEIRGSAYIEGPVLIGDPFTYTTVPRFNEASLMVGRCGNPEAC